MRCRFFVAVIICILSGCATFSPSTDPENSITVSQTPRGAVVTVSERILFDSGKSALKPEARELVSNISRILNERTKKNILIEGHTDNVGSAAFNHRLSESRAETVKLALIHEGVTKERLQTKGLGSTEPKADNSTESGRRINRRTEITILGESKENLQANGMDLEAALNGVWLKLKQMFQ